MTPGEEEATCGEDVTSDYQYYDNLYCFRSVPRQLQEEAKKNGRSIKLQDLAYAKADTFTPALITMARQVTESGTRQYWVGSWWSLYKFVMFLPPEQRTFYEMIRLGGEFPVNLYFDLEAYPLENPKVDFSTFLETFMVQCRECMFKYLPKEVIERGVKFTILNSTTPTKISYHVVARINGVAFKDMFSCGRFALLVLYELYRNPDSRSMFYAMVRTAKGCREGPSIDLSVFSESRNFRLPGNTKLNKNAALWTEDRYTAVQNGDRSAMLYERTMDGMREWARGCCTYFSPEERKDLTVIKFDIPESASLMEWIDQFESTYHHIDNVFNDSDTVRGHTRVSVLHPPVYSQLPYLGNPAGDLTAETSQSQPLRSTGLPYHIQNALMAMFQKDMPRQFKFNDITQQGEIYTTSKNCRIAQREHNGNHIYIVVFLSRDRANRFWTQKCKSNACSNQRTLPQKFDDSFNDLMDEYWESREPLKVCARSFLRFLDDEEPSENDDSLECGSTLPVTKVPQITQDPIVVKSATPSPQSRSSDLIYIGEKDSSATPELPCGLVDENQSQESSGASWKRKLGLISPSPLSDMSDEGVKRSKV